MAKTSRLYLTINQELEKKFREKVAEKDFAAAEALYREVISTLDRSAKVHTIHANRASRKKARLAAVLNAAKKAAAAAAPA